MRIRIIPEFGHSCLSATSSRLFCPPCGTQSGVGKDADAPRCATRFFRDSVPAATQKCRGREETKQSSGWLGNLLDADVVDDHVVVVPVVLAVGT